MKCYNKYCIIIFQIPEEEKCQFNFDGIFYISAVTKLLLVTLFSGTVPYVLDVKNAFNSLN